jgi:hypothetical protein
MTPRSNAENDSTRQKSGAVTYLTPTKGRPRGLIAWWRCSVLVGLSGVLALAATSRVSPELQMSADASRRRGQSAAGDDWICSVGAYRALAWRQSIIRTGEQARTSTNHGLWSHSVPHLARELPRARRNASRRSAVQASLCSCEDACGAPQRHRQLSRTRSMHIYQLKIVANLRAAPECL